MPKLVCSKEDWIKLGYQFFAIKGIDGLVVEQIASKLKCNKSSFYWHFKNKANFVDEIIDYWVRTETHAIINLVDAQKNPKKKYAAFLEICFQHDPYLDFIFFLKRYAVKSKRHQRLIDEIDERRLEYTAGLFQGLGYSKTNSRVMASVFYKYLIGFHEMHRYRKPNKNQMKVVKRELSFLLQNRR